MLLSLIVAVTLTAGKETISSTQIEEMYLRHTRGSSLSSRHEARSFSRIIWKESRNNPNSKNPHSSAYGLGQLIKMQRDHYGDPKDANGQVKVTIKYIQDRYGKPSKALKYHLRKGSY